MKRKKLSAADIRFLKRWRELGYEEQEREYYRRTERSAPQSSHAIDMYSRTGVSGVQLVVVVEDAPITTYREPRSYPAAGDTTP